MLIALGALILGSLVTLWATTHLTHRSRLVFALETGERIDPAELGMDATRLKFGNIELSNLVVLYLSVENRGQRDVFVPDAGKFLSGDRPPGATPLPRVDLPRLGILAFRTLNGDDAAFWIPLARSKKGSNDPQHLHINIHRIRAGAKAKFKILGTVWSGESSLQPQDVHFFPGAIPDVDIQVQGLLSKPFLTH